jgi:hypothetical protein
MTELQKLDSLKPNLSSAPGGNDVDKAGSSFGSNNGKTFDARDVSV